MLEAEAKEMMRKAGKEHGRGMGKGSTELDSLSNRPRQMPPKEPQPSPPIS